MDDPFIMTIWPSLALEPRPFSRASPWVLPDGDVVERGVRVDRALGQAVVGDDGDVRVLGLLHRAGDGLGVHRVHDQHVDLVGHHRVDLLVLRAGVLLGVGVDDLALAAGELLDLLLDERPVELLVARGRVLRKEQTDLDVVALLGGPRGVGVVAGLLGAATGSKRNGHRTGGNRNSGATHTRVHFRNLPDEAATLRPRWLEVNSATRATSRSKSLTRWQRCHPFSK
ncbi:hypothetical protein QFZ43_002082 [Streptomyces afghaniensis]|nr:hypothetical protein [Streptomyces afghaniensis]